jgi:aminopeptidase
MNDDRWARLATQLVRGTQVTAGSTVGIFVTDVVAMPAVEAFVAECYRVGAAPQVLATDERFDRLAVQFASDDILREPPALELESMRWADVHVSFRAMIAPGDAAVDAARLALQRKAKGAVSAARWHNTRWALVRVPTLEWADLIQKPFATLLDEFFAGCLADWSSLRARWDALCRELDAVDSVRIVSDDTDLTLRTTGRRWVSFAGEANLPDGEIATAPIDDDVNGFITFPGTQWFAGVTVSDLRLEFTAGRVTRSSATEGQGFVEHLLETDAGARTVGEVGIGTNALVQTTTGDLLIDEKILGTVHIALGRAYPQCGGINESALHWDIVKDLRAPSGYLYAGDRQLIAAGRPVGSLHAATSVG